MIAACNWQGLETEEMFELAERPRGEEGRKDEDDREHEPEAEACRLPLAEMSLASGPPRSMEAVGALDRVRIERRPLLAGRRRLQPGHAQSVRP
jgi:hypothetical protein